LNIGNEIYQRIGQARSALFTQGELAQLTYLALESAANNVQEGSQEDIEISYPIGYRADKSPMSGSLVYKKQELIDRYAYLGNHQLAINGVYQLVAIIEALMGDVLRKVVLTFPNKIGSKRMIKSSMILAASSIEEIHLQTVDSVLNELAYNSPKDFAAECKNLLSVNLLECPPFHKYMEIKATRDIYIHNQGVANDIYIQKASSHSRVKSGESLPIDTGYFLEAYESCLQITEWLEQSLHEVWHSSELEEYNERRVQNVQQENAADANGAG
jgi:hypothetical protein